MMDAQAPITQDVLTIPRKAAEGLPNLVGMTRDAMRDAARAHAVAPPAVDKMFELQKLCIAGGRTLQACGLA